MIKTIKNMMMMGVLFTLESGLGQSVNVTLPELSISPGRQVSIDIQVSETENLAIYAFDATLEYDASIFKIESVTSQNTLTAGWGPPTYNIQSGQLTIGTGGSDPLSGSGILMRIQASVPDETPVGSQSNLQLSNFQFNEGSPAANLSHGIIRIVEDRSPPVFTQNLRIQSITAHSAQVRFACDEPARCLIEYGEGEALDKQLSFDDYVNTRLVTLTGLKAEHSYSVRTSVWDASGNGPTLSPIERFQTDQIRISLEPVTGDPGNTISVPLLVSDLTGQGVTSVQVQLSFDAAILSAVSVSTDESMTSGWDAPKFTTAPGSFELTLSGSYAIAGSGRLATLQFFIKEQARPGLDTEIRFAQSRLNNGSVPVTAAPGVVYIRDTTAPEFTDEPDVSGITGQSVQLMWACNEPVSTVIRYGRTQALEFEQSYNRRTTSGEATLSGLTPDQTYYYQLSIVDSSGNGPTVSFLHSFRTESYNGMFITIPDLTLGVGENRSFPLVLGGPQESRLYQLRFVLTSDPDKIRFLTVQPALPDWQIQEIVADAGLLAVTLSGKSPIRPQQEVLNLQVQAGTGLEGIHQFPVHASCFEANYGQSAFFMNETQWELQGSADLTAPQFFTAPSVEWINSDQVRVHWVCSEPALFEIHWGSGSVLDFSTSGSQEAGYHAEILNSLSGQSTTQIQVSLFDLAGNGPTVSEENSFFHPELPVARISLVNRFVAPGQTFDWLLQISDVTGLEVYSSDIVIEYDDTLIECLSVTNNESLTAGWGAPISTLSQGQVRIAAGGITPLSGSGLLFRLRFQVKPDVLFGQTTFLHGRKIQLNEGIPSASFSSGILSVRDNQKPAFIDEILTFDLAQTGLVFLYRTDEPVVSDLSYGHETTDQNHLISHQESRIFSTPLVDLPGDTHIEYTVQIEDAAGNKKTSQTQSFNTKAPESASILLEDAVFELADQILIPVQITEAFNEPLLSIVFELHAPLDWLTLSDIQSNGCLTENWSLDEMNSFSDGIKIRLSSPVAVHDSGCLFYLLFNVSENVSLNQPFEISLSALRLNSTQVRSPGASAEFIFVDRRLPEFLRQPVQTGSSTSDVTLFFEATEPVTATIEYGQTPSYGMSLLADTLSEAHQLRIENLSAGSVYHYRVGITDSQSNGPVWSSDQTFSTASGDEPIISVPDMEVGIGEIVQIPLNIAHMGSKQLTAYSLDLLVPEDLEWVELTTTETLTESWPPPSVSIGEDQVVSITHEGRPITQPAGTLCYLSFTVRPETRDGKRFPLPIISVILNDGLVDVRSISGSLTARDKTVPVFKMNPLITRTTSSSLTVMWETNEPVMGRVEYGLDETFDLVHPFESFADTGEVALENLLPDREYQIRVLVWDEANNGPVESPLLRVRTLSATVSVSLPDMQLTLGEEFDIPIQVTSLTGFGIGNFRTAILFDANKLTPLGVSHAGTLCENWDPPAFSNQDSILTLTMTGSSVLEGGGTLVWLRFVVSGMSAGNEDSTRLRFQDFEFNTGSPPVHLTNSSLLLGRSAGAGIEVSIPDTTFSADSPFRLPVIVKDVTGKGIFSFEGSILFPENSIEILDLKTDSTLTTGWYDPEWTQEPGSLTFHFNGYDVLAGEGILFYIVFRDNPDFSQHGPISVNWDFFQFNQGRPFATLQSGILSFHFSRDRLSGIVVHAETQNPIRNARIWLHNSENGDQYEAFSDSSGQFLFVGLDSTQTFHCWAEADGFTASDTLQSIRAGQQDLSLSLLPMDGKINGWIVNVLTGSPVHKAFIVLDDGHAHFASANTDSAGFFSFSNLSKKYPYALTVTKFGFNDLNRSGILPDTTVSFQLSPQLGKLQGRIFEADESPADDVLVFAKSNSGGLFQDSTRSDETGRFQFQTLPVDIYLVYPLRYGYISSPSYALVTLTPDSVPNLNFHLKEAILGSISINGPSEVPSGARGISYDYQAKTTSEERMMLPNVEWQVLPSEAGFFSGNRLTVSDNFLGPAMLVLTEPISQIADTLTLSVYTAIVPDSSYSLRYSNNLLLDIPYGSVTEALDLFLTLPELPDMKKISKSGTQVGKVFALTPAGYILSSPVNMSIKIPAEQPPSLLRIGYWNAIQARWDLLPTEILTDSLLTSDIGILGEYALIRLSRPLDITELILRPNPFSPEYDTDGDGYTGLSVSFLPQSQKTENPILTIQIFNMLGQKIKTLCAQEPVSRGVPYHIVWDGRTDASYRARNGRYFLRIQLKDPSGQKEKIYPVILVK